MMRLIANVESVTDDIRFLGIQYDENNLTNVFFLLHLHGRDFETCQYDDWFIKLEDAKSAAFEEYGIESSSWELFDK